MGMIENIENAEKSKAADEVKKQLTPDRIKYLQQFLDPESSTFGNKGKSGEEAGWTPAKTQTEHKKLLPLIQEKLEIQEIDLDYLAMKLKEGCEAEKTEFAKHEGQICDKENTIDYRTRLMYLDRIMKLLRLTGDEHDKSHTTAINIILPVNRPKSTECNKIENAEYVIHKTKS